MTFKERAAFYRKSVDKALAHDFECMHQKMLDKGCTLPDDIVCMIVLKNRLRELADEAEARIAIEAQLRTILEND